MEKLHYKLDVYQSKTITANLEKSHKSVYKSILGISVWLGYDSASDMLGAYGFTGLTSDKGLTAVDHSHILNLLAQRYADRQKPATLSGLLSDNPDLKAPIKTLSNRAPELFGTTLLQHLRLFGISVQKRSGHLFLPAAVLV